LYTKILILCIIGILAISFYTLARFGSTPKQKRNIILTIGAHPDDIELGCGGTLAKLKDQGSKVYGIIFSSGEKGIKDPKGKEKRKKEAYRVAKYLNFDHLWIYEFKDTELQKNISQMVKKIENRIRELKPDIVFTHSPQDIHQDHQAVFEATKIASRENVSLLCYEDVRTSQEFIPNFFVDIEEYIDDKLKLIKFYKSQRKKQYMDLECIKGRAAHRGLQAGVKYAEAFYVYKIVEK
ncbi:PIG-L family deacetylase, partial [Candidatus Aminicenantes bacterium AH-873-B07]|nr:PIG-L family deacetylase [Candidatus Aminicenantes bacterium AH-873-B07]